ncbi:type II toxin-antitoxin system Phd/YefM family antitoxin [Kribbella rubisoli]|nr:type II toxin-antitoxin system prevent-host-death family antitoxin [Kribbella rubisoli]
MMGEPAPQYNIHEAKTQLSRIIERVEHGEEVIISRAGRPVAKVVPLPTSRRRTGWGSLADQISLADDWDSPETNAQIADDFGIPS